MLSIQLNLRDLYRSWNDLVFRIMLLGMSSCLDNRQTTYHNRKSLQQSKGNQFSCCTMLKDNSFRIFTNDMVFMNFLCKNKFNRSVIRDAIFKSHLFRYQYIKSRRRACVTFALHVYFCYITAVLHLSLIKICCQKVLSASKLEYKFLTFLSKIKNFNRFTTSTSRSYQHRFSSWSLCIQSRREHPEGKCILCRTRILWYDWWHTETTQGIRHNFMFETSGYIRVGCIHRVTCVTYTLCCRILPMLDSTDDTTSILNLIWNYATIDKL